MADVDEWLSTATTVVVDSVVSNPKNQSSCCV